MRYISLSEIATDCVSNMKLTGQQLVMFYGVITLSAATMTKRKGNMDSKDSENLEKTQQIHSNCEEAFPSRISHCIEPFSRKVKQYTHIKPENRFVYQIFIKHACRKYKKMLLCVHTYLTNCPTKLSYSVVQHSLNQSWVPVVNQMCDINTNSSKQPIKSHTDQTTGPDSHSGTTPKSPVYQIQNDLPSAKSILSPTSKEDAQDSIYNVILDRIILPEIVIDSGVPVILNSKDNSQRDPGSNDNIHHTLVAADSQDKPGGKSLFYWMYIVIGNSASANQVQYSMGPKGRHSQGETASLSYQSSASPVTLSLLCLPWQVLVTVYALCSH